MDRVVGYYALHGSYSIRCGAHRAAASRPPRGCSYTQLLATRGCCRLAADKPKNYRRSTRRRTAGRRRRSTRPSRRLWEGSPRHSPPDVWWLAVWWLATRRLRARHASSYPSSHHSWPNPGPPFLYSSPIPSLRALPCLVPAPALSPSSRPPTRPPAAPPRCAASLPPVLPFQARRLHVAQARRLLSSATLDAPMRAREVRTLLLYSGSTPL